MDSGVDGHCVDEKVNQDPDSEGRRRGSCPEWMLITGSFDAIPVGVDHKEWDKKGRTASVSQFDRGALMSE